MKYLHLLLVFAALCPGIAASAETFEQVRSMASSADEVAIPGNVSIEGIVISDCHSMNNEYCPNLSWQRVDLGLNYRTAYIESADGLYGFRLVFDSIYSNRLERGQLVRLNLSGCTVTREKDPERYTISGLPANCVTVLESGCAIPDKKKRISEISDSDIFTFVKLQQVEFVSKKGSYLNIYENCAQSTFQNRCDSQYHAADGWASLLVDGEGEHIYMQLNSKVEWRRNNQGAPDGVGELGGVIVCNGNRRYGDIGRYSIRPIFKSDIAIARQEATSFGTVASWTWDRNFHQALRLRDAGERRWVKKPCVINDAVLPDEGEGLLYVKDAELGLEQEYNGRHCTDGSGTGKRMASALWISCEGGDWFRNGGLVLETSTCGISGKGLLYNFSFVAGNSSIAKSFGFPAVWTVEYSTDGKKYQPTGYRAYLRPISYDAAGYKNKGFFRTSYDAAMGYTEHSVRLPETLLNREKVYVRLVPTGYDVVRLCAKPEDDIVTGAGLTDPDGPCILRVGMVELKSF